MNLPKKRTFLHFLNKHELTATLKKVDAFSVSTMLIVNAVPLYGVVVNHWDGVAVISLYLLETVIIGVFHALRMLYYRLTIASPLKQQSPLFTILFFLFHYNFFVFVQSALFFGLAESSVEGISEGFNVIENFKLFVKEPYLISIYAFIVGQMAYSGREIFITNTYENMPLNNYMFLPYTRIFIQQFVVIFGAFIYLFTGSMEAVVVLLIILKTAAEYLGLRYGEKWIVPKKAN